MNTTLLRAAVLGSFFSLISSTALAQLSSADLARLGQDLTPTGAEKAASTDGKVPAWTGGLTQAPAGFSPGKGYVDPFASEKPLYTVTAANLKQYVAYLTPGYQALLQKYPDFSMPVYPSHRTAALPQSEYAQIRKEAATVSLANGGNGLTGYEKSSVPFPIPKSGVEVLFNHFVRYRTGGYQYYPTEMVVQSNGSFTPIRRDVKAVMASAMGNPEPNRLYYYLGKVTSPESVAGSQTLIHEPIDQTTEARLAWTYNPGQRRVLRAPEAAYDSPLGTSDGLRTYDTIDLYNGATDKYDWKLVGKQEMLVPYNTYKLADRSLKYKDIIQANHLNQDLLRYEMHRVWVVEGTLKPSERHIYAKRVFYVDEDSWSILGADLYDGRGELWRVQEAHSLQRYDVLSAIHISEVVYDLQARRYVAYGLENEERSASFGLNAKLTDFSPSALRRSGR
ncbi:DUF1329 domain-containing protein [Pseudomonas plecoglossicida]|uniref:DUF1329 domain-containing protein n=1 Tax=Pseudomonas plecoglossicida TaxID=70775 RepID=A0AAD0QZP3_PSEDL|nr:DUF1329 domain-containing protein [Pseudomonas plecoglossicida]AXM98020.1 DUF1329 domain-containing protein [Pseudomonas plecoglossicida]EPB96052.1 hypothetical protein L321_10189 [Pseudomonas plecoglossicida NB2011]QLB54160.1 DUF1329 domain-containing protein [Pseudomonas plecoglossicida]